MVSDVEGAQLVLKDFTHGGTTYISVDLKRDGFQCFVFTEAAESWRWKTVAVLQCQVYEVEWLELGHRFFIDFIGVSCQDLPWSEVKRELGLLKQFLENGAHFQLS